MNKNFIQKSTLSRTFAIGTLFYLCLLPFLLSAKANALGFNMNLGEPYYAGSFNGGYCIYYNNGLNVSNVSNKQCPLYNPNSQINQPVDIYSFYTQPTIKTDKEKVYKITFRILSRYNYFPTTINPNSPSQWRILSLQKDFSDSTNNYCDVYTAGTPGELSTCANKQGDYAVSQYSAYMVYVGNNEYDAIGIYADVTTSSNIAFKLVNPIIEPVIVFDDVYAYSVLVPELERAEQETQQATDEGNQNADSAGSNNEQASQSLLQTAGDIVAVFSAPATNCSLNADMGNLDLGSINFCQDKPSAIINIIDAVASIIVVFAVFRIIKSLVNRFISLSSYGQGGSDG